MSTLNSMDSFEDYPRTPLTLTLCLEENSILLSKAVIKALDSPKQVQMLINEERKMLMLQACTVDDREAVVIPQTPFLQFELSGHSLLKRIRKLTRWPDDRPRVVCGDYVAQHHVVIFDLMSARVSEIQMPLDGDPGLLI